MVVLGMPFQPGLGGKGSAYEITMQSLNQMKHSLQTSAKVEIVKKTYESSFISFLKAIFTSSPLDKDIKSKS